MLYYIIPAREGSRGFKNKNRQLFCHTVDIVPMKERKNVIVTTDDETLIKRAKHCGFKVLKRSKELCQDETSIKDVMINVKNNFDIKDEDDFGVLYLTYPQRKWQDVEKIKEYYYKNKIKSLITCNDVKTHPFLCYEIDKNKNGKPILKHGKFRRQEYPKCVELNFYFVIINVNFLLDVDDRLWHNKTVFFNMKEKFIDVDKEEDYIKFLNENSRKICS